MSRLELRRLPAILVLPLLACSPEVESSAEMPAVDLQIGELPSVDVGIADVEISTDTQTVRIAEEEVSR